MGKYFALQCKGFLRLLPWAILASALLLAAIGGAYTLAMEQENNPINDRKLAVALCGSTEGNFLALGLKALETFDSSRFSMTFLQMTEADAAAALKSRDISAYIVIPEGFLDEAFRGNILPLQMVTAVDAPGIVSLFRDEVSQTVGTLLLDAQRGVFGMARAFGDFPAEGQQSLINDLALEYAQLVFARSSAYLVSALTNAGEPSLGHTLLGGLAVLFLLLICLPFVPLLIRQNGALLQMLRGKGKRGFVLGLADFAVFALALTALLGVLLLGAGVFLPGMWTFLSGKLLALLPVILLIAAFSFFLCSLCSDLISGVLTQFFVTAAMGFVCGCMYPVSFFPETMQRLVSFFPAGVARTSLIAWIAGNDPGSTFLWLWGYSAVFVILGSMLRSRIPGRSGR